MVMRRAASLLARAPAALVEQVQQRTISAHQVSSATTFTLSSASAPFNSFDKCSCNPCGPHASVMQLSAARLLSSSSPSCPDEDDVHKTKRIEVQDSSNGKTYHVNPISLDQLLQSSPAAANASSSISSSSRGCSSSEPQQQQQQQQQLTEQLLSELFDAELEQRLLSAAATARGSTAAPSAAAAPLQSTPASNTAVEQQDTQQQITYPPYQHQASLQQQQQQRMHQPGVVPMQQQQSNTVLADSSSSSSSNVPARVSSWTPFEASDPWAPIPGPAFARRRLPHQLQQLLTQAGVSVETAAAAVAQAATAAADAAGTAARQPMTTRNPRMRHSFLLKQQQQQQQRQHDVRCENYLAVFNRLQQQQLISLLDDCQAPTYGSKQVLLRRLVLLLKEQAAAAAAGDTGADPQGSGNGVGVWEGGEQGYTEAAAAAADGDSSSSSSGGGTQAAAEAAAAAEMGAVPPKQQQQPGIAYQGSALRQQVQEAAAARQQLLQAVLDAGQVGSWLVAARAQDVCVIDVRGRVGLHQQLVVATGLSQRHAHACAEAVAWQLREKAKQHLAQQQQQQQQHLLAGQLPALAVLGDAASDWAVLDAGAVVVHVLTERARRFYNLEGLWGGSQGRFIQRLKPVQGVETKDTIGGDAARAMAGSDHQWQAVTTST